MFFELVEVSLGDIFVFNAPLETIVVLIFYILHFFCKENITNVFIQCTLGDNCCFGFLYFAFFLHGEYYQCFGKVKKMNNVKSVSTSI
jgi:hypothetical protein